MDTLLESLSNGKVPWLYNISVVRARHRLADEQQIAHFVVDKVVIALNIGFIDIDAGGYAKQVLYLVDTSNAPIWSQLSNHLERTRIWIRHFLLLFRNGHTSGASIGTTRISFLFTNSWMPRLEGSRPEPKRLFPPNRNPRRVPLLC